ncbi:deoxyribonuclease V [Flavobacterium sp. RHBU_24]|uniref:deoxyribonuclease V n=1 Tax=Flavobacterium sp. RHBU_24 TaxID=3391185 RepID=UPI003984C4E3
MQIPDYNTISVGEATDLQNHMRQFLSLETFPKQITTIAGADISHNKDTDIVYAGIIVLSYPQMVVQSYSLVQAKTTFPYIPGYLGFREVPALLEAWQQVPQKPDVMVLDGQGITHPRRMGIASHFGLLADCPAIGCAKNMLFGKFPELGNEKFNHSPINSTHTGELLGYALRTKKDVKEVYISPGHKVSVPDSLNIITNCVKNHRIPEPTRQAHEYVNLLRTGKLKPGFYTVDAQGSLF